MASPFESATLNLKLFELRRDPVLREARQWWLSDFTPATFDELMTVVAGERNASFRMVSGYWDMAASMVTFGAIDAEMFRAANPEIIATVSKIYPFLTDLRAATKTPDFFRHAEAVVVAAEGAVERMAGLREHFLSRTQRKTE